MFRNDGETLSGDSKSSSKKIHRGKLVTLEQLREKLANDFGVQTACPASTTNALKVLSKENRPVCYWRVIKKKGELIAKFPNGVEGHASLLQDDGYDINFKKRIHRLQIMKQNLRKFDVWRRHNNWPNMDSKNVYVVCIFEPN